MDLLEDGFDLLILTTSKWCDPRGHQPLYRQVWAKKVRVSNTSTTSKKSQLVLKKSSTGPEPFSALLPGVGLLLVLLVLVLDHHVLLLVLLVLPLVLLLYLLLAV